MNKWQGNRNMMEKRIRAVRGATTVADESEETLQRELTQLIGKLIELNNIEASDVVTFFLSVTKDITQISPAKIIRLAFNWDYVPIMCVQEADIKGYPDRCVRVLIQFYTDRPQQELVPVYLNEAAKLRPDWAKNLDI
jgi:chorismate mutase